MRFLRFLSPKPYFIGLMFGFMLCCIAGYLLSKTEKLAHFSRFFGDILPRKFYYPTAAELLNTARHKVKKDKILVLIGGSSIFRGVGQNPDNLWTTKLKTDLGDKFFVLNYAVDGGQLPNYAGVIYRSLRDEYSKIILVSTCQPSEPGDIDGVKPYDYLFWDAYYKNLFHPNLLEKQTIYKIRRKEMSTAQGIETHILNYLDSLFFYKNLWNEIAYRLIFTVWTDSNFSTPFIYKRHYSDESLNLLQIKENEKNNLLILQLNMDYLKIILTNFMGSSLDLSTISKSMKYKIHKHYQEIFSESDRKNILCVVPSHSPIYLSKLPKESQKFYHIILKDTQTILKDMNYHVIIVGEDFKPEDFHDGRHFSSSGGYKTATSVSEQVKKIALENGYLS